MNMKSWNNYQDITDGLQSMRTHYQHIESIRIRLNDLCDILKEQIAQGNVQFLALNKFAEIWIETIELLGDCSHDILHIHDAEILHFEDMKKQCEQTLILLEEAENSK